MAKRISRFVPLVFWSSIILWLSLQADPPTIDMPMVSWDKFQHAAAYAVLTLLAGLAFQAPPRRRLSAWVWAFLFAVFFGGLLEIAQGALTRVRSPEWADLLADCTGAAVILMAAWWNLQRKSPPEE